MILVPYKILVREKKISVKRAGSHRVYSLYLFSPVKPHLLRKDLIDHVEEQPCPLSPIFLLFLSWIKFCEH